MTTADTPGTGQAIGTGEQPLPKYYRVKLELREAIDGLPPGTALPPERELADSHDVARATLRQALQELVAEGRLRRWRGRGTFVAPPKITLHLALTSFTAAIRASGRRPSSRVLHAEVTDADDEVRRHLELQESDEVLEVGRLRLADNEPLALEVSHLPAEPYAELASEIDAETSLYELLEERFGVVLDEAEETIETVPATPRESKLLQCDSGAPLLVMRRVSWTHEDEPVEYVRSMYRGDRFRFTARLRPPSQRDVP